MPLWVRGEIEKGRKLAEFSCFSIGGIVPPKRSAPPFFDEMKIERKIL